MLLIKIKALVKVAKKKKKDGIDHLQYLNYSVTVVLVIAYPTISKCKYVPYCINKNICHRIYVVLAFELSNVPVLTRTEIMEQS